MNLLNLYRHWRLHRAIRHYADWFFRESPIHRYLREKHGEKINAEMHSGMMIPKQYAPLPPFGPPKHVPERLAKSPMHGDEVKP